MPAAIPAWRRAARETLLTAAAVIGVICVVAALAAVVFDVRPLIFRTGSMAPEMPTGALALARTVPADEIAVGDVVSVRRADGVRVTHRVVGLQPAGSAVELTLQGDGNTEPDAVPYPAREADRVFWSQPGLGRVVHHLESTPVVFACGAIVGAVFATAVRHRRRLPTSGQPPRAAGPEPPDPAPDDPRHEHADARDDQRSGPHRSRASGPVPTGYRVRVRSNVTGNIIREQILGPAARSYQIPADLLQIGTYRVSVRSLYGSWVAPAPSTPPFVLVTVLTALASSCG
ncbi:S26 family signal peptidase [Phytoactinopolyspora mesophila]|uniref:Peptidase S26 domain-containing protein n=1 Tax=Phytoactinopolyspora mesophila TaxID=2650750 RepID=A0A7K3LWZ5_9ACTN|nr:S26 family signal peptidase [Phytoactinopolyspora mesophila]NDL55495.1 hypothetical protein [Phytoactinopolyspora mesophila]